jgi:hypothetical protein
MSFTCLFVKVQNCPHFAQSFLIKTRVLNRALDTSDSSMSDDGDSSRNNRMAPAAAATVEVERQQTLQPEQPSVSGHAHEEPSSLGTAPSLEANREHQQTTKGSDSSPRLEENKPWIPSDEFPGRFNTEYLKYYIFSSQRSLETSDAEWAKSHESERERKTRELLAQMEEMYFNIWASVVCFGTLDIQTVKEFEEEQLDYLLPYNHFLFDYESLQKLLRVVFYWCFGDQGLDAVENHNPKLLVEKIRKSLLREERRSDSTSQLSPLSLSFKRIGLLVDGVSSSYVAFGNLHFLQF